MRFTAGLLIGAAIGAAVATLLRPDRRPPEPPAGLAPAITVSSTATPAVSGPVVVDVSSAPAEPA